MLNFMIIPELISILSLLIGIVLIFKGFGLLKIKKLKSKNTIVSLVGGILIILSFLLYYLSGNFSIEANVQRDQSPDVIKYVKKINVPSNITSLKGLYNDLKMINVGSGTLGYEPDYSIINYSDSNINFNVRVLPSEIKAIEIFNKGNLNSSIQEECNEAEKRFKISKRIKRNSRFLEKEEWISRIEFQSHRLFFSLSEKGSLEEESINKINILQTVAKTMWD